MKKHSIESAKELFKKEGYKLLSTEYKNTKEKLNYICPNGHNHNISLNMWLRGNRCGLCCTNKKKKYEDIKKYIENTGYILLSEKYEINKKLILKCPKGHISEIKWNAFQQGVRCSICSKNIHLFSDVVKLFKTEGYIVTSQFKDSDIIPRKVKINYICPNGHVSFIKYSSWIEGYRCKYCQFDKVKLGYDYIKNSFEKEGYILLSDVYINSRKKLKYQCPNNHKNSMSWFNWNAGWRCPTCSHHNSSYESELKEFLIEKNIIVIQNDRKLINPYEIDLYLPEYKIAIEICGIYWHSSKFLDKNYHLNKLNLCNSKNIELITIFEDEWLYKKDVIKNLILNKLNLNNNLKLNARDLTISLVDNKISKLFLDNNHIQGNTGSNIKLGLFDKNELVFIATFSKPSISKGSKFSEGIYELSRMCSKQNYIIRGGFSKLLKYFIKNYSPKEIYSYSDRRWFSGGVYEKVGFKKISVTKPNYWYVKGTNRLHRFNFRKSKLKDFEFYSDTLSEIEIMALSGYKIIYDCGNFKYNMAIT